MAITIISNPNNWTSAFNDMAFNVSSTNSLASGFQFLADVNVSGQINPVARLIYPKQPNSGQITFDVSEVVQNYVSYDLSKSFATRGVQLLTLPRAAYWVGFGEITNNASGVPTIASGLASFGSSGAPKYGTNAAFEFLTWNASAYEGLAIASGNQKALNQDTFVDTMTRTQQRVLQFFDVSGRVADYNCTIYNQNGVAVFGNSGALTPTSGIISLNIGKTAWDNLGPTFNTNFAASGTSYVIWTIRDASARTLYTRRINIVDADCRFDMYRLHWLNSLGGFDAFNFNKVSIKKTNIDRNQFKKFQPIGYRTDFRGKSNYFTKYSDSVLLNSDGLTNQEWQGLKELFVSPVVFYERDENTLIPVNIVDSNYDELNYSTSRSINNLQFTIEFTFDNYRQTL